MNRIHTPASGADVSSPVVLLGRRSVFTGSHCWGAEVSWYRRGRNVRFPKRLGSKRHWYELPWPPARVRLQPREDKKISSGFLRFVLDFRCFCKNLYHVELFRQLLDNNVVSYSAARRLVRLPYVKTSVSQCHSSHSLSDCFDCTPTPPGTALALESSTGRLNWPWFISDLDRFPSTRALGPSWLPLLLKALANRIIWSVFPIDD